MRLTDESKDLFEELIKKEGTTAEGLAEMRWKAYGFKNDRWPRLRKYGALHIKKYAKENYGVDLKCTTRASLNFNITKMPFIDEDLKTWTKLVESGYTPEQLSNRKWRVKRQGQRECVRKRSGIYSTFTNHKFGPQYHEALMRFGGYYNGKKAEFSDPFEVAYFSDFYLNCQLWPVLSEASN